MELTFLKGVGETRLSQLNKLGIFSIYDLITHFPRTYQDKRIITNIADINFDNDFTPKIKYLIKASIFKKFYINTKKGRILKIIINDETGNASLLCFNRNFYDKTLEIGTEYMIYGTFSQNREEVSSIDFEIEKIDNYEKSQKLIPIYSLTEGLTQKVIRKLINEAIKNKKNAIFPKLPDNFPIDEDLFDEDTAINIVHNPNDFDEIAKSHKSLKFYEAFSFLINNLYHKERNHKKKSDIKIQENSITNKFIESLPYKLTNGQEKAFNDIKEDFSRDYPMNRLIQGDVGVW